MAHKTEKRQLIECLRLVHAQLETTLPAFLVSSVADEGSEELQSLVLSGDGWRKVIAGLRDSVAHAAARLPGTDRSSVIAPWKQIHAVLVKVEGILDDEKQLHSNVADWAGDAAGGDFKRAPKHFSMDEGLGWGADDKTEGALAEFAAMLLAATGQLHKNVAKLLAKYPEQNPRRSSRPTYVELKASIAAFFRENGVASKRVVAERLNKSPAFLSRGIGKKAYDEVIGIFRDTRIPRGFVDSSGNLQAASEDE
ncbi:MAG: hypothetical protein IT461_15360 [Planctomycetes bacterium]|nr:hypothetical protein [Planctomycetota bacterium]